MTAAGNYEYKFIVDGRWMTDPTNPFSTGHGDYENSFIALKANHIFELKGSAGAKSVILAGSFNGWNTDGYRMVRKGIPGSSLSASNPENIPTSSSSTDSGSSTPPIPSLKKTNTVQETPCSGSPPENNPSDIPINVVNCI